MATPITTPFALSGDKDTVPATDGAGAVNWTSGWTSRYSLSAPAPERLTVDRKAMNYVDYVMSDAIREMQKQGTANWYPEHAPYVLNAQVFHNGKQWRSLIANNSTEPADAVGDTPANWADVSQSDVTQATFLSYGTVKLATTDSINGGTNDTVTANLFRSFERFNHEVSIRSAFDPTLPYRQYQYIKVATGTSINIGVQAYDLYSTGDSATCVVMLDKREMTGAAPTLTVTASGAGAIVLKPEGSDTLELSDTTGIAMLYITTMYIDGAQVVTCNLQEWESV